MSNGLVQHRLGLQQAGNLKDYLKQLEGSQAKAGEAAEDVETIESASNIQRALTLLDKQISRGRFSQSATNATTAPEDDDDDDDGGEEAEDRAVTKTDYGKINRQTEHVLSQLLLTTAQAQLNDSANMARDLLDPNKMLTGNMLYTFRWSGGQKDPPTNVAMTKECLGNTFSGVDLSKKLYVFSASIVDTFSTWQTPLSFDVTGLGNNKGLAANLHKTDGRGHTWVVWPGLHSPNKVVHSMQIVGDKNLSRLIRHSQADYTKELDSLTALPNEDLVLVSSKSNLGDIIKKNEEHFTTDKAGMKTIAPDLPFYRISKRNAAKLLSDYNDKVLLQLPCTDLLHIQASVGRLDQDASEHFGSTKSAAGLTPSAASVHGDPSMEHQAWVLMEMKVIDPEHMESMKKRI